MFSTALGISSTQSLRSSKEFILLPLLEIPDDDTAVGIAETLLVKEAGGINEALLETAEEGIKEALLETAKDGAKDTRRE